MRLGQEILYLANADIEACGLGLAEVEAAVEAMFAAKAAGTASMKPKVALASPGGALFLGSAGVMTSPPYAGVKWVGVAGNQDRGLPCSNVNASLLLNSKYSFFGNNPNL